MATTLNEVMALADNYAEKALGWGWCDQTQQARKYLAELLEPIIADAQHYRSLQGKTDEQAPL